MTLYETTVRRLVAEGSLDPAAPTLVVAGGETDRAVLLAAGFTDVTISNLDTRMTGAEFAPCRWRFLDGENLAVEPGEYAQIIEHMGLHHCASPHRALTEMLRCAGTSVLAFENRDSLAMRLATRLGFAEVYEFDAVAGHDYRFGGWRNTAVPNGVYRWTEREIDKLLRSWSPERDWQVRYFYGLRLPNGRAAEIASPVKRAAFRLSLLPFALLARLFPRQMNEFGWFIDKRAAPLQPWIEADGGALRRNWRWR